MKAFKSLIFLSLASSFLMLNTACNDWQIGAALGAAAACVIGCSGFVYGPAPVIYGPGPYRPYGPYLQNNLPPAQPEFSKEQLVNAGKQNYNFDSASIEKLMSASSLAQNSDVKGAATSIGLTSTTLKEMNAGKISDASAEQIATAIGSSTESARHFLQDIIDARNTKTAEPIPNFFDNCENCG